MTYDHNQILDLLTSGFNNDELDDLIVRCFPQLTDELPPMRRSSKAAEIISYARRQNQLPQLVACIAKANPTLYQQYADRLLLPASDSPATQLIANAPYGLESAVVGREAELALLDDWFANDNGQPLLAIIGLGGQGKSALTWAWLQQHLAAGDLPPLVVWWSFYETDGTMARLVDRLLEHFGDDPQQFSSFRAAAERLQSWLQRQPVLLMFDGAERILRAYSGMNAAYQADDRDDELSQQQARQCVDPVCGTLLNWLAQPQLTQARTVLTSRLFPSDLTGRGGRRLQGVRRHDLTGLSPEGTLALFRQQGIGATRAEVVAVAEPLGYHPLSLRLLAGYVASSFERPNDLLAAVDYDPTNDLLGQRQHVLQRAYANLPATARHLLSRLAAFRSGVAWLVVAETFGGGGRVQQDLRLLEQRGLLQRTEVATQQADFSTSQAAIVTFDLHPIVRRYAYDRLTDPAAVHAQLVGYFEAVPKPTQVRTLADLTPTIELYHHLVRAERYDEALTLFRDRLASPLYFQLGAYQTRIDLLRALFPDGEKQLPRLSHEGIRRGR